MLVTEGKEYIHLSVTLKKTLGISPKLKMTQKDKVLEGVTKKIHNLYL